MNIVCVLAVFLLSSVIREIVLQYLGLKFLQLVCSSLSSGTEVIKTMLPFLYLGESPSGSCHRHFSGDWLIPAGECELSDSDDTKGAHVLQRSSSYLGVRQHQHLC